MTAKHFAASRATIENTDYTDTALDVINVFITFIFEKDERAMLTFNLLKAYLDILTFRENFDDRNESLWVKAASNVARKSFFLQTQQLDSQTFAKAYENVHKGRLAAEALNLHASGDYFTMLSFEWYNNNRKGRHQDNHDLLLTTLKKDFSEPFQRYFLRAWMCISSYYLSRFEVVLEHYVVAYELYLKHADHLFLQQKQFTFFKQDLGVIITVFAARAAFMLGRHKRSEQILHDLMTIVQQRKEPTTTLFGMMFGSYQLAISCDLNRMKYFLDYAEQTLQSLVSKLGNALFMNVLFKLYTAYYVIFSPESTDDDRYESYLLLKKMVTNPDFDANQIFHVNLLASGCEIVRRLLNKKSFSQRFCSTTPAKLLKARQIVSELIPLSIDFSKSHQQHVLALVYMYAGLLHLMSFAIDRTYESLKNETPDDLSDYHEEDHKLFTATGNHRYLEPFAWVSRGASLSHRQGARTIELICSTTNLKCDLVLREFLHVDRIHDDYQSLKIKWKKLDFESVQMDLEFMRDAKRTLEEAEQILRVHELLIYYQSEKLRRNLTNVADLDEFIEQVALLVHIEPKKIIIHYYDRRFKEKIELDNLELLPNPCKLYISVNE